MEKKLLQPGIRLCDMAHGYRAANLAYHLACECRLSRESATDIYTAALYHDIGKSRIPKEIADKPGPLTEAERRIMQMHVEEGVGLCRLMNLKDPLIEIIYGHHENYDGTGYPQKLTGKAIAVGARILKICDVFDALTDARIYRAAFSKNQALETMMREAQTFDPDLMNTFLKII